ncbi:MAG: hypothetical protein ACREX8_06210, partial [Gammaproteobacteria bacterium]
MPFPSGPIELTAEMFLLGNWLDVTANLAEESAVTVTRGAQDEDNVPTATRCAFRMDNSTGDFSPPNPSGAYWDTFGQNTLTRLTMPRTRDTFTRAVVNGWGSNDYGLLWTTIKGSGGTIQASDYQVTGSVGTISVPVANGYRFAYLPGLIVRDVDVMMRATLPFTDVTGAPVYPICVQMRGVGDTDWVYAACAVATNETVSIGIFHFDGTVIAPAVTVPGLTHISAQALIVRAAAEGHTYRAKVWRADQPEPASWQARGHFTRNAAPGWIGGMVLVPTGNTNTKPI